jgi:hypothetical protein
VPPQSGPGRRRPARPHGPLAADAAEPAWNGYLLTVACPCGVVFGRWVTPEDAELDRTTSAEGLLDARGNPVVGVFLNFDLCVRVFDVSICQTP